MEKVQARQDLSFVSKCKEEENKMIKRALIKGISIIATGALIASYSTGIVASAAWTNTYDFNDTSWHTTVNGNDTIPGFINFNCGPSSSEVSTDIGVFPYERVKDTDYAVKLKSIIQRVGTGFALNLNGAKTSGTVVSEFEIYLPDFNAQRSIHTRNGGDPTASEIAKIGKNGKLSVYNETDTTEDVQLEIKTWYTIRLAYNISLDKTKGGTTTVDVYRDGVCIGHINGIAKIDNHASYDGKVDRICFKYDEKLVSSTVIDNWKYEYSADYKYLYEEFNSDFSGSYVGTWSGSDNSSKTYTIDNGYYKLKAENTTGYFNGEYNLLQNSYFSVANENSIGVDYTVNFPDFNSAKSFMIRSGTQSGDQFTYATVDTKGALKFIGKTTKVNLETKKDYKVSFKYNMQTKYGYLTVSDTDGTVLYDSSKVPELTTVDIAKALDAIGKDNAVQRVGFGIAGFTGTSEIWLNDLSIYQVANDSFPTQAVPVVKDEMKSIDLATASFTKNSVNDTDNVGVADGAYKITLNDDDYAGAYTSITENNTANNFVIKGSVKLDTAAASAEFALRNNLKDTNLNVNYSTATFVKFDNTTAKIYAADSDFLVNNDGKDYKTTELKEIGACEPEKWYDVTIVLDQNNSEYVVKVDSEGTAVAYGEGALTSYDLPVQYLLMKNGNAGDAKLTGASVYFKDLAYGVVKTAPVPKYVSASDASDLPLGAGVALTFDNAVNPCSFAGMTANGTTVTKDMITCSNDGKTIYISGLEPNTEYTFETATIKSLYGADVAVPEIKVTSGTYKNYITKPVFTDASGNQVRQLRDITDGSLKVSVTGKATSGNERNTVNLIAAQYSKDGRLIVADVKMVPVNTSSSVTELDVTVDKDTSELKAFIWDLTENTIEPIYNAKTIN